MAIVVSGVPASRKLPGILLNVVLGGPGTSAGNAVRTLLLLGNMLVNGPTGSSPSFAQTSGNYQTGGAPIVQAVQVFSAADAGTRFGYGSELHCMAVKAFAQYPDCPLFCAPVAEASGGT